jgi:hypothetical protein
MLPEFLDLCFERLILHTQRRDLLLEQSGAW